MKTYPPEESGGTGPQGEQGIQGEQGPAGADGGFGSYGGFSLSTGGITGISNTALTLVLNNSDGDSGDISLASNEVTVSKTATFLVMADAYINNSSTSRSEYSMWLEEDSGGGFAEVARTRFANYARGYDSGHSSGMNRILSITSGNKYRLRIQRTDGAATVGYQDDNGTRLNFAEVG